MGRVLGKLLRPEIVKRQQAAIVALVVMAVVMTGGCTLFLRPSIVDSCSPMSIGSRKASRQAMEKLAEQGDEFSQYRLGTLYSNGYTDLCRSDTALNLPVDHEEAYFWFDLVKMRGGSGQRAQWAARLRDEQGQALSEEQRNAAHARALAWKPLPPDAALPKTLLPDR